MEKRIPHGLTVAVFSAFLLFLNGCAGFDPSVLSPKEFGLSPQTEEGKSWREGISKVAKILAKKLNSDLYLKSKGFIIVPSRGNQIVKNIDEITRLARLELIEYLIPHKTNLRTRHPMRGQFQPHRIENIYCGDQGAGIDMYLILEVREAAGKNVIVLKAYDLAESKYLPILIKEDIVLTEEEKSLLKKRKPDTYLEGTSILPIEKNIVDQVGRYVGYNFGCIAKRIDTGEKVRVKKGSLGDEEKEIWKSAQNYIRTYRSIDFVKEEVCKDSEECFPIEIKVTKTKDYNVFWVIGPDRFSVRAYYGKGLERQKKEKEKRDSEKDNKVKSQIEVEIPEGSLIEKRSIIGWQVISLSKKDSEPLGSLKRRAKSLALKNAIRNVNNHVRNRKYKGYRVELAKFKDGSPAYLVHKESCVMGSLPDAECRFLIEMNFHLTGDPLLGKAEGLKKDRMLDPRAPLTVRLFTEKSIFHRGELISLFVRTNKPAYVRVITVNSKGHITQLFPNEFRKNNYLSETGKTYSIPDNKDDQFQLKVTNPPFGKEKIIIYAATIPMPKLRLRPIGGGLGRYDGSLNEIALRTRNISVTPASHQLIQDAADNSAVLPFEFYEKEIEVETRP